jgi:hypothetical protein
VEFRIDISIDDALLKQAAISRLEYPPQHDLRFLRDWFKRPMMGAFPLLGLDRSSWNDENNGDLVSVMPRQCQDLFTSWFSEKFIPAFHHIIGGKFKV